MRLELVNINKSFGNNHVLKDLSFCAQSGSAFGLLGRNGSGKTTTIRIIMDIFSADSGEVLIDGAPINTSKLKIGYLPEERGLYPKHVIADQMVYFGQLRGMKAGDAKKNAEALLEKLEATEYLKKKLDTLSKGNQQKIQLAIALLNDPDIIILDEPFSGLDPVNAKLLKDLVSELVKKGKTVIFSSHQMSNVEEFCDDICIINFGESVLTGNLKSIKKQYPRNRVLIVPENEVTNELLNMLNNNTTLKRLITDCSIHKNGCLVTLAEADGKPLLLNEISKSSISIDSFYVVEPTLEEIFIEKAGGANETA